MTQQAKTYALASCAECGCATAFATSDGPGDREFGKNVGEFAARGDVVRTTTSRDELDEHMKTWGDCVCPVEVK